MRIIQADHYEEMSKKAAGIIKSLVLLKPDCVLGLAAGDTPLGMYRELIEMHERKEVDFSEVTMFSVDEYCGLDKECHQSYHYYMNHNFFQYINVKKTNTFIPNGMAEDLQEECRSYEQLIKDRGGIDLQILGIGANGHIGFNEPDVEFHAETHLVQLDERTIKANARFFPTKEEVPTTAISMGVKTILNAGRLLLLASGESKAFPVQKAIQEGINPQVPASVIQLHPDAILILEKNAAKLL